MHVLECGMSYTELTAELSNVRSYRGVVHILKCGLF